MPPLYLAISIVVVGIAIMYGFAELRAVIWPVPTRHWQIPREWGRYGRPRFATVFGLILGAGFFTVINFIGYYLLLANCILIADPLHGSMLMATYGAARAAPLILAPLSFWIRRRTYTFETAVAVNEWFVELDYRLAWLRASVLFAFAGSVLVSALNWL
jgi:hypothetical protein